MIQRPSEALNGRSGAGWVVVVSAMHLICALTAFLLARVSIGSSTCYTRYDNTYMVGRKSSSSGGLSQATTTAALVRRAMYIYLVSGIKQKKVRVRHPGTSTRYQIPGTGTAVPTGII